MKNVSKRLVSGLASIFILLVSLTITLLNVLVPFTLWVSPVLNFFCFIFIGFGLMSFVFGVKKENPWFLFVSTMLLGLAVFYIIQNYIVWWLSLIIIGVIVAIVAIFSFILLGSNTEETINKADDYKDYKQRKEEKLQKDKKEEDLPKIKSFK